MSSEEKIDFDYDDDTVAIPLAPVYLTDRIALILAITAVCVIALAIFVLPAFYTGNLSDNMALILTLIPVLLALLAALLAIPDLIAKRSQCHTKNKPIEN